MNEYLVSVYAKLFTIHRIVKADTKAEALEQVGTEGGIIFMVVECDNEEC